ncbi:hypothetical protein ABTY56_38195, partial [Kitasatospora sp. NPDC097691]
LAERAGNWAVALEWYRHFLTAAAAPASATGPAAGCALCDRPATGACAGCGREACPEHLHAPEGTGSPRCVRCAGPALRAVLDCARRVGVPEQAEPVLAAWATALGDSAAAGPVRLDLALLRAELGRHDEALAGLPADATAVRAAVLVRRAGAALAAEQPGRAAGDLRQALTLAPGHPQAAGTLVLLAEHEAHQHATEGRHREAWAAYRELLLKDPAHPRLLHALGLAGYRLATASVSATTSASASEAAADGTDTAGTIGEEVWAWTLGCLVAALHQPELWAESARITGRTPEPQRLAAARTGLIDRLRDDLRALDRAAGRGGDEMTAWTLRLGMEAHSADAFAREDIQITLPGRPARRLTVGPTLDRLLRAEPELAAWAEAFEQAVRAWRRPAGPDAPAPTRALGLFGELGPQRYLQLQGRQAAAVAALDAVPQQRRGEDWQSLLGESLVSQAREHHRNQDWREALDCLTRARSVPGAELPADAAAIAAESGVRAARALLKSTVDDQPGAAELLEKAYALAPDDPEVRGDLGATYAQWARKINNEDKDYTRALDLLQKSMDLVPGDPTARHFLEAALGNRAGQLSRPEASDAELEEAADAWRALISLNPDPDHRLGLAFVLRHLARSAAFADNRVVAVQRMAEALDADPEWDGDAEGEAPRRVAVMLANHVVDNMGDKPFTAQAAMLQKAKSYDDSTDIRRLMVSVWRGEAIGHYEARRYQEALRLLEEALGLSRTPEDVDKLRRELGIVYGSYAVQRANARQLREARELARRAVEHNPEDQELRAMQRRINSLY